MRGGDERGYVHEVHARLGVDYDRIEPLQGDGFVNRPHQAFLVEFVTLEIELVLDGDEALVAGYGALPVFRRLDVCALDEARCGGGGLRDTALLVADNDNRGHPSAS